MGSFSWYASDTKRAIRSSNPFPVYALRPDGEPLLETDYEGYGEFGGEDIYNLVADWNRQYMAEHPEFVVVQHGGYWDRAKNDFVHNPDKQIREFAWYPVYADLTKTRQDIEQYMKEVHGRATFEYRHIGIELACYDDQNGNLPFPIKLVEKPVPYAAAGMSYLDPAQGWGTEDRFENRSDQ